MKKYLVYLIAFICINITASSQSLSKNVLLQKLDSVVKNKQHITLLKEKRIKDLKELLKYVSNNEQIYRISSKIFDEYRAFCMDSSEVYAQKKLQLAKKMGQRKYLDDAIMNLAEVYGTEGMYKEALDRLNSINKRQLSTYLHPYYFHLYRTIYGLMSDYSLTESDRRMYARCKETYRDSLLSVNKKQTYLYALIQSDGLIEKGKNDEAIKLLTFWLNREKSNDAIRTLSYTLAMAYKNTGNKKEEEFYLILSAISDLQQASKEYASLMDLSKILYEQGDLDRAYNYLKCSMEDATYCNARLRTIEVSEIFPIVEQAYQQKLENKEHQRSMALVGMGLASMILSVVLFFLFKQRNKLSDARKKLINLNNALQESNGELKETNLSLIEANHIKEGCISRYIGLCSLYIEKMNEYRHSLIKTGTTENSEALYKKLRSTTFIEDELKDFYLHFDHTFLELFPTFVEEFNCLLTSENHIYPKIKGQLNTELRIFALIRLGITDSTKIAGFLRYSVTTIYNYRVKVRNSASGDRNLLEDEVMKIGKISLKQH